MCPYHKDIALPCPESPLVPAITSTDVDVSLKFADIEFAPFTTQSFSYYCGKLKGAS